MINSPNPLTLLYQSERLLPYPDRLIHGFTGKPLSLGGPDTPENPRAQILSNRQALLDTFNIGNLTWRIPQQVHGHRVGRSEDTSFQGTDAVVVTQIHQPAMVLAADCVPILLYDPICHTGAVIHSGWRGTAQKIVQEAILTLENAHGAKPEDLIAVIGPAISLCCFQVSQEVAITMAGALALTLDKMTEQKLLDWDQEFPENPRMDLKAINTSLLQATGVKHIETLPACTRCDEASLFSYRRGEDGRNSAFLMLKPL